LTLRLKAQRRIAFLAGLQHRKAPAKGKTPFFSVCTCECPRYGRFMFDYLRPLPPDGIIALMQQAKADERPNKVDLGVGVYKDAAGAVPVMRAVKTAEEIILGDETSKSYVGTTGRDGFNHLMLELMLGSAYDSERLAASQAAGGSGALRLGAELIRRAAPEATVWVSTPTWANHIPLISSTGLKMDKYPYYDRETLGVDFDAMVEHLKTKTKPGDVVVLHGCCHNPTGADLTDEQWDALVPVLTDHGLLPFIDLAYAGLGHGLERDCYGLRTVFASVPQALVSVSCSKNFGLYKERVGVLGVLCAKPETAQIAQTQLGSIQRTLISMPPDHGAQIVERILGNGDLKRVWMDELDEMRNRMLGLRRLLSEALDVQGGRHIARAVLNQNGMFSTLPITKEQAQALRKDHAVYLTDSGRINVAGANASSIPGLAKALLNVLS
jgi:aspartate aminotransferase